MALTPHQQQTIDQHLRSDNWLLNERLITELTDHYTNAITDRLQTGESFEAAIQTVHQVLADGRGC